MRVRVSLFFFVVMLALSNVATGANIAYGVQVVVIDAGHGGKFPGAHYGATYEKEITLDVALKLGKLIEEKMPGVKVVYTRTTDKELGNDLASDLQARADIANGAGGDLFISIHVNAARATAAQGVETLIMGETPKEQNYNTDALYENNREDLIDMSDARTAAIVRAYIQNLQFTYGQYSMAMASCIQSSYAQAGRHTRGIKPQLLRVLYATDMPGVLTEIGFMSNPREFAYLKSEKGQNQIAASLLRAVENYSDYVLRIRAGAAPVVQKDTTEAATSRPAAVSVPAKTEDANVDTQVTAADDAPLRYTIQVMAGAKPVALSSAEFKSYRNKVKQYKVAGRMPYKYCTGDYATLAEANKALPAVRKVFKGAFVVKCRDGEIVN